MKQAHRWPSIPLLERVRLGLGACLLGVFAGLSGCDQLGIETPQKAGERQAAEAKAIGSACRHALRAIEDCYALNPKADKSSVFAGWREMDEYMRENKLEGIAPVVPRPDPAAASKKAKQAEDTADEADAEASAPVKDEPADKPSKSKKGHSSH